MATITVKQSDGDYSSLATALNNANNGDTINIEGGWSSADTNACTVADSSITIQVNDSSSAHPGYVKTSDNHYRIEVSGDHCFTVNSDGCTIDGMVIKQAGTGVSVECIRMAASNGTLTVKNCILYAGSDTSDQDGIYVGNIDCTVNVQECIIYGFERCGIHPQNYSGDVAQTWNIRSSSIFYCGTGNDSTGDDGGIGVRAAGTWSTININVFNTMVLEWYGSNAKDYRNSGASGGTTGTINWDIHQSFDSDGSIASRDSSAVNCQGHMTITDDNTKSSDGDWVIVKETASGSEDFRLQSNTYNEAQDYSSTASGAGMAISSTDDITGTSRPQNTNYDVGAFEVEGGYSGPTMPIFMHIFMMRRR